MNANLFPNMCRCSCYLDAELGRSSELLASDSRALTICNLLNILMSHRGYYSSVVFFFFFSLFYSWNSYCNLNAIGLGLKEILAGSVLRTIFLWQQKEGEWMVWFSFLTVVQMKPELETTFKIEELSPVHNCVSLILWVPRHINYSCKEEILRNFFWGNHSTSKGKTFCL